MSVYGWITIGILVFACLFAVYVFLVIRANQKWDAHVRKIKAVQDAGLEVPEEWWKA